MLKEYLNHFDLPTELINNIIWFVESYQDYEDPINAKNSCIEACENFRTFKDHDLYQDDIIFSENLNMTDLYIQGIYNIEKVDWPNQDINHTVIKYKDVFIDFTAKQYNSELGYPFVFKLSDWNKNDKD
jgi:hypothetical protein